jgi:hypothetical protein
MAGLDPAIHVFVASRWNVDACDKRFVACAPRDDG